MISHPPVSDFWAKKINFQEGYKIEVFIFTTGGADPKAGAGELSQILKLRISIDGVLKKTFEY